MELSIDNHSSYPLSTPRPAAADTAAAGAAIDAVVHAQEEAGLDVVTDGQVRWADPVSPLMGRLDGVRLGAAVRYFDTAVQYRQPVVVGALRRRGPILCDDFAMATRAARARVKAVLVGPYTLARLSRIEAGPYADVIALAHALGEVLADEVKDLVAVGARLIQVDEPAILFHPADVRTLRAVLEPLWLARGAAQLSIATYFGDAEPLYAQLDSLPADIVAVDCICGPALPELIAAVGGAKVLALGLVDGREPRVESPDRVARQVESMLKRYTLDAIHLQPSCGLGYLPPAAARAKLDVLRAAGARIRSLA